MTWMLVVAASVFSASRLQLAVFAERASSVRASHTHLVLVSTDARVPLSQVREALAAFEDRLALVAGIDSVTFQFPTAAAVVPASVVRRDVIDRLEQRLPDALAKARASDGNPAATLMAAVGPFIPHVPPRLTFRDGLVRWRANVFVGIARGDPDVSGLLGAAEAPPPPLVRAEVFGQRAAEHKLRRRLLDDLRRAATLGVLLVVAGLGLFFRSALMPLVLLGPTTLAVLSTAGALAFFDVRFSPVAWASAVILVGLGVDYALHIALEAARGDRSGLTGRVAVREAIVRTRVPIAFSAATTAGSVAALYLSEVRLLHQLATVFLVGMSFVVLYSQTLLRQLLMSEAGRQALWRAPLLAWGRPRLCPGVLAALVVGAMVASFWLKWESPSELDLIRNEKSLTKLHRLSVEMGASFASLPMVSEGNSLEQAADAERRALAELAPWRGALGIAFVDGYTQWAVDPNGWTHLQDRLASDSPLNLDRLARSAGPAPGDFVATLETILEAVRGRGPPHIDAERYVRRTEVGVELVARIHALPKPWGTPPFAGFFERADSLGVPARLMARIDPERGRAATTFGWALAASLLWVAMALVVQFRDFRLSVLCLLPVGVGFAAAVIVSAALGISASFLTLPGWCLVAGVGVDDSIHVLHRLRLKMDDPLSACAPAMVLTTVTTIFALAGFAVTTTAGLYDFAIVAAAGLTGALFTALGPVPWLYERYRQSS